MELLTIQVCVGSACHLKGSYNVINKLIETIKNNRLEDRITVKAAFCIGQCTKAVSVRVNNKTYSLTEERVEEFLQDILE